MRSDADGFMPHGFCYLWRVDLLTLHIVSDFFVGLAYMIIPVVLYVWRAHLPKVAMQSRLLVWLFATFILACGMTHFADIVVLFVPLYYQQGVLKAITAFVSLLTALATVNLISAMGAKERNAIRRTTSDLQ